jgi:hypothetical protein
MEGAVWKACTGGADCVAGGEEGRADGGGWSGLRGAVAVAGMGQLEAPQLV